MSDWHNPPATTTADLEKAKQAIAGEAPIMEPPPAGDVTLFKGLFHEGRFQRDAEVKELTGADEEAIARAVAGNQEIGSYYNAVLVQGVVRIGGVYFAKYTPEECRIMLDSLLLGDKELLFVNVLKVTYGDERTIVVTCPSCGKNNDVIYTLSDDVKMRSLDSDADEYVFTLRDGTRLDYRLFTGADQAESVRRRNITTAEQNTILLSRAITQVGGRPLPDSFSFARDMGASDRRRLLEEIQSKQPGPYFEEVKLPCASCVEPAVFKPTWADLL